MLSSNHVSVAITSVAVDVLRNTARGVAGVAQDIVLVAACAGAQLEPAIGDDLHSRNQLGVDAGTLEALCARRPKVSNVRIAVHGHE